MATDPPIAWPHAARCAVVLTIHLDAELLWLRLDPSVARRPKTRSIGTYGARRGVWRVLDVLEAAHVRASWFIPAAVAANHAAVVDAIHDRGHEIACRGYDFEDLTTLDRNQQGDLIGRSADLLRSLTGVRPVGFRPFADMTGDTAAVLEQLGFTWSSSTRGDDRPFFLETRDGASSIVEIPYHWELQDAPYFLFNYGPPYPAGQPRIACYSSVLADWKAQFDAYHRAGLCFVLTLDPQAIGTPGRIGLLQELLEHMVARGAVWFTSGRELADYWKTLARANDRGNGEATRFAALLRGQERGNG